MPFFLDIYNQIWKSRVHKTTNPLQLFVCACSHVTSCPAVLCPIEIRQKYVNCAFSSFHNFCGIASELTQGVTIVISSGKNWTECLTTFCLSFSQQFLNIFLTRVWSKLYLFLGWWSSSFLIKTNQIPTLFIHFYTTNISLNPFTIIPIFKIFYKT